MLRGVTWAVLVFVLLAPAVAVAQPPAAMVEKCSRECEPKAVNGESYKTGTEPVTVFLYAHVDDVLNMAPLTTQAPDPRHEKDENQGFLLQTIGAGACASPIPFCLERGSPFLMYYGGASVGFDEGVMRVATMPGLNYAVPLVGSEVVLYWYMSPGTVGQTGTALDDVPGVMPLVGVHARMETGRFAGRGTTIAESDFNAADVAERTTMISMPGTDPVYEFRVAMPLKHDTIPVDGTGFFLVAVQPYQVMTSPQGAHVSQSSWRLRTGPDFPIRILVSTIEPLRTISAGSSVSGTELRLWWNHAAVLGNYDRREDLRLLALRGNETIPPDAIRGPQARTALDKQGRTGPENITWTIDFAKVHLADGSYEFEASVPNLQDTYLLRQRFAFEVQRGQVILPEAAGFDGNATPTLPMAFLVLSMVVVAALRRRAHDREQESR